MTLSISDHRDYLDWQENRAAQSAPVSWLDCRMMAGLMGVTAALVALVVWLR